MCRSRGRRLWAATVASLLLEVGSQSFVVQLALDSGNQAASSAGARHDEGRPEETLVNMTIGGRGFRCSLPDPSARAEEARNAAARYAVTRRAAALIGERLEGEVAETGESFNLRVGESLSIADLTLTYEEAASSMSGAGFRQRYAEQETGAVAEVVCRCRKGAMNKEPPRCALGDTVWLRTENNQEALAMVVGHSGAEELFVRWTQPGHPRNSFPVPRRQLRSSQDAQSCAEVGGVSPSFSVAAQEEALTGAERHFRLDIESVTCCAGKDLESEGKDAVVSLLSPLRDRCLYAQNGWWSYELCWPFHVRQLHFHTVAEENAPLIRRIEASVPPSADGEPRSLSVTEVAGATLAQVGSAGAQLGRFANAPLERRRSAAVSGRPGGRLFRGKHSWPQELAMDLEPGEECKVAVQTWNIQLQGLFPLEVAGVGGHFNPAEVDFAMGPLAKSADNEDACTPFTERFDGAVLLARRGNCFFQVKAAHAEDVGAVALIVYNDDRPAIESMEGVEEFVPPRIPTVFVLAEQGATLSRHLKSRVRMSKDGGEGLVLSKPIQSTVVFHCNEDFQTRKSMCQTGDAVDVKLWVKSTSVEPSRMPWGAHDSSSEEFQTAMAQAMTEQSTSLRLLRAHVLDAFPKNGTLLVQWLSEQEQDPILGSIPGMKVDEEAIAVVPLESAFRDGVLCSNAPNAFIEKLLEPISCQAEFLVHVSSLCADSRLAPEQMKPPQAIACLANDSAPAGQRNPLQRT